MLEPERILRLEEDAVVLLDQRRLPLEEVEVRCQTAGEARGRHQDDGRPRRARDRRRCGVRHRARGVHGPGPGRGRPCPARSRGRPRSIWRGRCDEMRDDPSPEHARRIHADEVDRCRSMAAHAAELFAPGTRALTHCNAGGLATGGYGSAVGALLTAWERGLLRARVGRRDAAAAAGCPPHRLGARSGIDPAHGDRGLRGRVADGGRRGGVRDHRRRPDRCERRHREQDRHVLARGAREPPRDPALRRRADDDPRPEHAGRRGDPDRGTSRGRDHARGSRPATPPSTSRPQR